MRKFLRLSIPPFTALLLAAAVAVVPPAGNAAAATTIYYNGAGSAPRISVVGDSTIAALRWTGQFEPLKRFNYVYDAESCRRILYPSCRGREGYAPDTVVQTMRRLSGQLGSVFVIMGGYDDSNFGFSNGVDAVMAEASRQGIPTVLWLSLRASDVSYVGPGSISNSSTFRANNRTLYSKAIQYGPRLQIADWASYSANHPEWFYSDGIHFRPAGANVAATYIADQAARVIAGQIVTPAAGRARPSAPRSLTAAVGPGVGQGNVRLTWSAPSATGGVPITDYVVQRSWNGGATWTSMSDGFGTQRSFLVTRQTIGATYQFRVAARNSVGWGPASNVVSATPQGTIPSAPRSLAATAGPGRVHLTWSVPSTNGGLPITDYVVQRSWNGGATWISMSDGLQHELVVHRHRPDRQRHLFLPRRRTERARMGPGEQRRHRDPARILGRVGEHHRSRGDRPRPRSHDDDDHHDVNHGRADHRADDDDHDRAGHHGRTGVGRDRRPRLARRER